MQAWTRPGNQGEASDVPCRGADGTAHGNGYRGGQPPRRRRPGRGLRGPLNPRLAPRRAHTGAAARGRRVGEITIDTYAYEDALYTDEAGAGHPYPLLRRDQVGGPRPRTYRALRLRNAYLELTFLPELGGRLYQARYLPTGQDLLYNNRTIKPTHWGPEDQGWWLAVGGSEFCLPVNEHGYVTRSRGIRWCIRRDGSATATMSIEVRSRHPGASRGDPPPGRGGVHATDDAPQPPGRGALPPVLDERHALAGYAQRPAVAALLLPGARGDRAQPRRRLAARRRWGDGVAGARRPRHEQLCQLARLPGVLAPNLSAPYTAVYDDAAALGMVRAYPPEVVRGNKLFAFGPGFGGTGAYTDDGSQYVEMWSGLSATFWEDVTLAPGATVAWSETWYAIAGTGGPSTAGPEGALSVARDGATLRVGIGAIGERRWTLRVLQGGRELRRWPRLMRLP